MRGAAVWVSCHFGTSAAGVEQELGISAEATCARQLPKPLRALNVQGSGSCHTRGRAGGHEAAQEPPRAREGGLGAPGGYAGA